MRIANKFVSNRGVQKNLEQRLRHNEMFRNQIAQGKIKEEFASDKLEAARARIEANFLAGLMYTIFKFPVAIQENIKHNYIKSTLYKI